MGDANTCNQLKLGDSVLDNAPEWSGLAEPSFLKTTFQPLVASRFFYLKLRREK